MPLGASLKGARPVMRTPLNPPPPYCSVLPFHASGRFSWNLIADALGSTGAISPRIRQLSLSRAADSILAPLVGRAIREASIVRPAKLAQPAARFSCEG